MLTRATEKALLRSAIRVQNEARRRCPVDTGTLRRSITFSISGLSPETMSARVGSNVEYALAVEVGTGIYGPRGRPITPVRAQVLVFPGRGGRTVYARSVRGRPATPYLKPALDAVRHAA